jgi:hypothetical protein
MDLTNHEMLKAELPVDQTASAIKELTELQLAAIGGGNGDVAWA